MYLRLLLILILALSIPQLYAAQNGTDAVAATQDRIGHLDTDSNVTSYILGPEDSVLIRVLDADEIGTAPYAIDLRGDIDLPRIGRIHAAGLTTDQLETELTESFKEYLQNPIVNISVAEFRSQPISILGAVGTPGVHQIRGRMTLFEAISEAGGLSDEAGNTIKITRQKEYGRIPLANATTDSSKEFSVAEVSVRSVMRAQNPDENIAVQPYDVITVPKADLVYVVGAVKRSGGFVLSEKANMSVLEALSMAEGLDHAAGPANAKILRSSDGSTNRSEIPVDLRRIMEGKQPDVPLLANDILFVPSSAAKTASLRALEAMIQAGTGIAVYGHY